MLMRETEDAALAIATLLSSLRSRACGWLLPDCLRAAERVTLSSEATFERSERIFLVDPSLRGESTLYSREAGLVLLVKRGTLL